MRRMRDQTGFTLLEVMIGAAIVIIPTVGLAGSRGAPFLADSASRNQDASLNVAQQTMEEIVQLDYEDALPCDGDTILAGRDTAVRISVMETMIDMLAMEVYGCRPIAASTVADLAILSLTQFRHLPCATGLRVCLVTYKTRR